MRNRFQFLLPVLDYLGALLWTSGFVLLAPVVVLLIYAKSGPAEVSVYVYFVPAVLSLALGLLLKRRPSFRALDSRGAMLLCAFGWIVVSAIGALPFCLGLRISYLDAFFEAVSGFTTTGITMLSNLDTMPRSILFWRALIQWLGGLGILAFFLVVVHSLKSAHRLFTAESHKIFAKRPAPSLFHTLKIFWTIYAVLTVVIAALLRLEGMSTFDAITHSLTALATGGYSTHDASIGYFSNHPHGALIEYTVLLAMVLGGLNFFIHYRVVTGGVKALWDNAETRLFWMLLLGATALVMTDQLTRPGQHDVADAFRHSAFQVTAVMTTTGFATKDIGTDFPALARLVFLVLMVVGGCVGSTSGGIKVLRISILMKMIRRQVRRVVHGPTAVNLVTVDGEPVDSEELRRIAALFFAWMLLLVIGAGITAFLSDAGPLESASGMFSALGNIGPCYIPARQMAQLHPGIKLTYILGMLAGRLEILPILLLFTRRTWR
jgi:trk system potassium uptake protein TrkH